MVNQTYLQQRTEVRTNTSPGYHARSFNFSKFRKGVNKYASYILRNDKTYLFRSEKPQFLLAPSKAAYHLKIYSGPSTTPDHVAELITPRSGEMLCVLSRANKILAYSRAAVQTSFSTSGGIEVPVRSGNVHLTEIKFLVEEQFDDMLAVFLSAVSRKLHLMGFGAIYIACRDKHRYGLRNIVKAGFELQTITSKYRLLGGEIARTVRLVQYQKPPIAKPQQQKRLPAAASSTNSRMVVTSNAESHHK